MAFGPESHNPRERRAYAHAVIDRARKSGALEDLNAAKEAIKQAGNSSKTVNTNFDRHLDGVAMTDANTSVIVNKAKEVLDPNLTPRQIIGAAFHGKYHSTIGASVHTYSPNFSFLNKIGASMGRAETLYFGTRDLYAFGELTATDLEGDQTAHRIPTHWLNTGNVDILGVRRLPDAERATLATIVNKI